MNAAISEKGRLSGRVLRAVFVIAVLALCVRYIVRTFAWAEILSILRNANLAVFLGGSCATLLAYWALRAWRWSVLLETVCATPMTWRSLYLSTACSLAFAIITPFQSGEALKVEMLGRHGRLGRFDGYSCFAIERILDLLSVILVAVIGLALNAAGGMGLSMPVLLVSGAVLLAGLGVAAWWAVTHSPWRVRFKPIIGSLIAAPGRVFFAWLLSLAGWIVLAVGWHWCLTSIGIHLAPMQALSLTATITLINVLSLVPGAVGVSEAGISVALGQLGHPATLAQSAALMIRGYGLIALALGLVHFGLWRLASKTKPESEAAA